MAIVVNAFTAQNPLTAAGLTGVQILKLIPAPRVFMKVAVDPQPVVIPAVKSNGVVANLSGWTDLGIVDGMAKLGYNKKTKEIKTGIDNVLRAAYVNDKTATLEFNLSQVDDTVLQAISGLTASLITSGSVYAFHMGQEDLVQMSLLLVVQSKLDGKELQFYNPNVYMNFEFVEASDMMQLKCTALLPFFSVSGQTNQDVMSCVVFK